MKDCKNQNLCKHVEFRPCVLLGLRSTQGTWQANAAEDQGYHVQLDRGIVDLLQQLPWRSVLARARTRHIPDKCQGTMTLANALPSRRH